MATNKAGIYLRVSTNQQEVEGTSLETQEEHGRTAAELDGYTVEGRHVWRETASGSNVHRSELNDLRAAVRNREIDALYIYDPDRLARAPLDLILVKKEIEDSGVHVQFIHGHVDAGPHGELILYIQGYVGAQELEKIRRRSMDGKQKAAALGRMPIGDGRGHYGYGYDRTTKRRYIIPEEAKIIRRIFHELAAGQKPYAICCRLQEEGIPTKRGGAVWHVTTLLQIANHTSYFGVDYYGKQRIKTFTVTGPDGKPKTDKVIEDNPPEAWIRIEGFSPAIITKEEYDAAHRQLAMAQPVNRNGRINFLSGITKCPCGGPVVSNGSKYYLCKRSHSARLYGERSCSMGSIPKQALEDVVWSAFVEWVTEPDRLICLVRDAVETDSHHDLSEEIAAVKRAMEKISDQQYKTVLYADSLIEAARERLVTDLTRRYKDKENELASLRILEQQQVDLPAVEDRIAKASADLRDSVDTMDNQDKQAALTRFGVQVVASRDDVEISMGITESDVWMSSYPSTG